MPLKFFSYLNRSVDRLRAEENSLLNEALAMSHSGEAIQAYQEKQRKIMGKVIAYDEGVLSITLAEEERDREGLMTLKELGRIAS